MIDWLVSLIFKSDRLYKAIKAEIDLNNMIGRVMNDPESMETAAAFWDEGDGWRGWTKNDDMNRYFFNDIPEHSILDTEFELDEMQGVITLD